MYCKKCGLPRTVILRQKDFYCEDCFTNNINHKFRACIGKNKVLSPNENVLICLSNGVGSTVLLDLLHHGLSLENTKKLRIIPFFLHIYDEGGKTAAEAVIERCKQYNFDVRVVHLSDYLEFNMQLTEENCIPHVDTAIEKQFKTFLHSMPPTAINDFLSKVKRNLFIKYSKQLQCKFIFTAETTSTLAINLLCNIVTGRGSQIQSDVGFCDNRDNKVKILRPMKDITKEELDYYVELKQLQNICETPINDTSLQCVISSFVNDLQKNSPSTISTVCKTADKIGQYYERRGHEQCVICESDSNTDDIQVSALAATNISSIVSSSTESNLVLEPSIFEDDIKLSMLSKPHKNLCYGCNRNYSKIITEINENFNQSRICQDH